MWVSEAMTRRIVVIRKEETAYQALRRLVEKGVSGAPVVDENNHILGVVSEYDLLLALDFIGNEVPVVKLMNPHVVSVPPDSPLEEARQLLLTHNYRRVPVVKDSRVVGMLARRDILRATLQGSSKPKPKSKPKSKRIPPSKAAKNKKRH